MRGAVGPGATRVGGLSRGGAARSEPRPRRHPVPRRRPAPGDPPRDSSCWRGADAALEDGAPIDITDSGAPFASWPAIAWVGKSDAWPVPTARAALVGGAAPDPEARERERKNLTRA